MTKNAVTIKLGWSLQELIDSDLSKKEWRGLDARFKIAGVVGLTLAGQTNGVFVETTTLEVARNCSAAAIFLTARRFNDRELINWETPSPGAAALKELARRCQTFDRLTRLRLAASDMSLVEDAALALIDAHENDGPARLYDRVIETGMVVTYLRPFMKSNEAGLPKGWVPKAGTSERNLLDDLNDLRNEYHAHASHTPHRTLENAAFDPDRRPQLSESWSYLGTDTLRTLAAHAKDLHDRLDAKAEEIDVELFGPRDDPEAHDGDEA